MADLTGATLAAVVGGRPSGEAVGMRLTGATLATQSGRALGPGDLADLRAALRAEVAAAILDSPVLRDLWQRGGLDPSAPMTITDTELRAGDVRLAISDADGQTTVQRQ